MPILACGARRALFSLCVSSAFLVSAAVLQSAAQPAIAEPQVKTSEKFGKPMSEAVDLVKGRKYREALAKVDQAAPLAQSRGERLAVEQMRTAIYSGLGKQDELIKSLEAQLAIGGLPAATLKAHRQTIAGLYANKNDDAKAAALTKDLIKDYGGSADQFAYVASYELKHKNYADALAYANKAISSSKAVGKKPQEAWRKLVMRAEFDRGNLPGYYAAVEQTAAEHPKPEYLRILIERAQKDQRFNTRTHKLDVYRALEAANVKLDAAQRADMVEMAYSRGLPDEALAAMKPLAASGFKGIDASRVSRLKKMSEQISADAKGALDRHTARASSSGRGDAYVRLGETYLAQDDPAKAVEAIRQGIAKGDLDPGETAYASLQLGIALHHAGKEEEARKTWAGVKSDNGAATLAKAWSLMSKANLV